MMQPALSPSAIRLSAAIDPSRRSASAKAAQRDAETALGEWPGVIRK